MRLAQEVAGSASSRHVNPLATDSPQAMEETRLGLGPGLFRGNLGELEDGARYQRGHWDVVLERRQKGSTSSHPTPVPDMPITQRDGLHLNGQVRLSQPLNHADPGL